MFRALVLKAMAWLAVIVPPWQAVLNGPCLCHVRPTHASFVSNSAPGAASGCCRACSRSSTSKSYSGPSCSPCRESSHCHCPLNCACRTGRSPLPQVPNSKSPDRLPIPQDIIGVNHCLVVKIPHVGIDGNDLRGLSEPFHSGIERCISLCRFTI